MTQERYEALRAKLDAKADELQQRHQTSLVCRKGCHGCCQPHLSVFPVEARAIQDYLHDASRSQQALALEAQDPFDGEHCAFLSAEGACLIYSVRPLICRSHGLPLQFHDEADRVQRDVCPLNFTEQSIDKLSGDAVLNLDLINALLTLINQEAYGAKAAERVALRPSAILDATL